MFNRIREVFNVGRIIKQNGKVVKTEKFTTNYRPEDDVTCTNPKP